MNEESNITAQTMEDHLQTEQFLKLDEEQLQVITGGDERRELFASVSKLANYGIHNKQDPGLNELGKKSAAAVQRMIRNDAKKGETFDVSKAWTNPLTGTKPKPTQTQTHLKSS